MKTTISKILKLAPPIHQALRSIYYKYLDREYLNYDPKNDLKYNEHVLSNLGLDIKFIKSNLVEHDLNYHDQELSWHYHLFLGFKGIFEERNKKIDKILEIGTFDGTFTNFLSNIFPHTQIISIDQNENELSSAANYSELYLRDDQKRLHEFLDLRNQNVANQNIEFKIMNSLELENTFENRSFDLIWIDGDHLNPQVTIDIMQCLKLIKANGMICVDDVVKDDDGLKGNANLDFVSSESFKTLEYLGNAEYLDTNYLLKRASWRNIDNKKFISISSMKEDGL